MSIKQLIKDIKTVNLAANLSKKELDRISLIVSAGYEDDNADPKRVKWAKDLKEYVEIAMQTIEEKSDPWEGCANIKIPLLTEAAIQFNARAYPALIPATNIVKTTTTGDDSQNIKAEKGKRIGQHMTYQLQDEMEEWEDDMDKGLIILPITGCFFKKTFHNPDIGRSESRLVMPYNLIIKYDALSLDRAPRISEILEFYPMEVKEKQESGIWLDIDIQYEDEDQEVLEKFVSQHTYLDIRGARKIPYIVTFHEKSKEIVRVVANYTEADIYYNDGTEIISVATTKERIDNQNIEIESNNIEALAIAQQAESKLPPEVPKIEYPNFDKYKKISRVDAIKYYTKYGFLPSPDGSIYDLGLGQLLQPISDAADTLVNQMLDAGTAANLQGGFMAKGVKTPSGTARPNVTEFTKVETGSMSLKESILPFNFPGPSVTAFNLLSFLIDSGKAIANLKDILSGEAPQGETATTSMIKREEGMRIYNAIYKRVYKSFKKELKKLYNLNVLYLPQETYFNVLDTPTAIKKTDYTQDKTDVSPTADPSESTQSQRMMKAEAGLRFVGDPEFNSYELKKRYLEAIEVPNIDVVLPPPDTRPDPPPDPQLIKTTAEVQKLEAETKKTLLETAEVISKVIKNLAEAESKEAGQQLEALKIHADFLIKKGVANGQTGGSGVAQSPTDQAGQSGNV